MLKNEIFIAPEEWDKMSYVDKILCPFSRLKTIHYKRQQIIDSLRTALLHCKCIEGSYSTFAQLQSIILKMEGEQEEILKILKIKEKANVYLKTISIK